MILLTILSPVLDNDPQSPPSKRADGKIILAYVSDDFKTKIKMLRHFLRIFFFSLHCFFFRLKIV